MVTKFMIEPTKSAHCQDCGKHWDGANAQAVGFLHARKHGHNVSVEILLTFIYDGRPGQERTD